MIGQLSGRVMFVSDGVATVFTHGVGYEVHCNVEPDSMVNLWTHEHAPQDAPHELYGFKEIADRDLFRRLLKVKGVGPKVGMRIVAAKGINRDGIPFPVTLASVRGVGSKLIAAIMEEFNDNGSG